VFILIVDCLDVICGKLDPLRHAEHAEQDGDAFVRSHALEDPDPAGEWPAADANAIATPKGDDASTWQADQAVRSGAPSAHRRSRRRFVPARLPTLRSV
jgi:hypothetical protein